jgi:ABC-type glycerol-3-phosphate transport system substrate-binding protein
MSTASRRQLTLVGSAKDTKTPDQAYVLQKFLFGEQFDREYILASGSGVPAYTSLIDEMEGQAKGAAQSILVDGYACMSAAQGTNEVWALEDRLLSDLWIGEITPQEWIDHLAEHWL